MKIVIAGGTGMIGRALTAHFQARGDTVVPLSRRSVPGGIRWDPVKGTIDAGGLDGASAVINLAGENLAGGRWTDARKQLLVSSRVLATRLLAETIAKCPHPPGVFVSASAIGIYGNRDDTLLDENAPLGNDFLAQLANNWEASAGPARDAGIRVVHPRFGIVLTPEDGALAKLLPSARLGLGGPVGSGAQWWSWIALSDLVQQIDFLMQHAEMSGVVNAVAPHPVRQRDFAQTLGNVLHRPAIAPMPAFLIRLALGEMADAALLASARVVPGKFLDAGFQFEFPTLDGALRFLLDSPGRAL